jgi:hypothetical protein
VQVRIVLATGSAISLRASDRFLAWLVTGPVGRLVAFVLDLGALARQSARRRLGRSDWGPAL